MQKKSPIDAGVGNNKSGLSALPLVLYRHLCVGLAHSPGILSSRMHGADKGFSVTAFLSMLALAQGSQFWVENGV